jgi:hypothetical protein
MNNYVFLGTLLAVFGTVMYWGFSRLPEERWQILASLPVGKTAAGRWNGVNITWYGLLNANANAIAVGLALLLLCSLGLSFPVAASMVLPIMLLSLPAAKIIARLVEKKSATLTVAGATFVGCLTAPLVIFLAARFWGEPAGAALILPAFAAFGSAYAIGEGLGRLACLSFGCCYGKPLDQCGDRTRRLLKPFAQTYIGHTKKAAYEGKLEGVRTVPVQALTSIVNVATGLGSIGFFLNSRFTGALLLSLMGTQVWRIFSETLRADYRGPGRFSVYQFMAVIIAIYACALAVWLPSSGLVPNIKIGLAVLWAPGPLLLLQALWFSVLWFTGRSAVTASFITFHVVRNRI